MIQQLRAESASDFTYAADLLHPRYAMNLLLIEDHADIAANITEFFEGRGDAVEHVATARRACRRRCRIRTTRSFWTCFCRDSTACRCAASCATQGARRSRC